MLKLVSEKLKTFGSDLSTDTVASTNDVLLLWKKIISPYHQRLINCVNTLYNKNKSPLDLTSEDSENDESGKDFG